MSDKGYTLSENSSLALDLLRAGASQAVVIGHGISYFGLLPSLQPPGFPYIQNLAVVVFFVLSGFLITYATLRKPPAFRFREFFIDRFARIYAAYAVVLVLVLLIDRWAIHLDPASYGHGTAMNWKTFVGNVFMLQDHPLGKRLDYAVTSFGSARPLWTLAIEWWIYMGFGWLVLRGKKPLVLWLALLAVLLIVPAHNVLFGRGNGLALVWIFGALLYLATSARRLLAARTEALVVAFVMFAGLAIWLLRTTKEPYDPKFAALFAAALLCAVLAIDRIRWRVPPFLAAAIRFVANYSFTLYLLHYSLLDLIAHNPVFESPRANFWFAVVCANSLSIVVAYFTEFRHRALAAWLKTKLRWSP